MDMSGFQRIISDIAASGAEGLERLLWGSFTERNPGLGKYRTCPFCHKRRFEFSVDRCCNASHATSKRAYEPTHDIKGVRENKSLEKGYGPTPRHEKGFYQETCEPRVSEFSIKKFVRKLNHSQPSPTNMGCGTKHLIHNVAMEMQNEVSRNTTQLLLEGLLGFHTPIKAVEPAGIPVFAEKIVTVQRKHSSRRRRKAQQLARRINFGLVAGKDGIRRKK